jgi:hypothetical protein
MRSSGYQRGLMIDDVVLKRFDAPDETRVFEKGRFEIVHVGGMYAPRVTTGGPAPSSS